MAKIFFILVIMGTSFFVKAKGDGNNLMKLIEDEEKALLSVPVKKRWPALYWKLMLLNMEKFRIVRSEENEILLKEPPDVIAKKGRQSYFKKSSFFYKKIKKLGKFIVKRWPKFEHGNEVYYSLAITTVEQNDKKEIEKEVEYYLKKGLVLSQEGSVVHRRIVIKLADHYYSFKKYKQASQYYEKAINFNKDKWHTRYLFNLAWSLMSINKIDRAKKYIRESLSLSILSKKNGQYVDYSDNVLDSLPLFIDENNLKESIAFFENIFLIESEKTIVKAAENAQKLGKYELADYFFKKAFAMVLKQKKWKKIFPIVKKRLGFYLETRRNKKFIKFSRNLAIKNSKKKIFNENQKHIFVEIVKRHIRNLQDKSVSQEINNIVFNFETLKILDPQEKNSYSFYQGEALYERKKYSKALAYYRKALDNVDGNEKNIKNIFDSIIKSLEKSNMSENQKKEWNKYIYTNHIKMMPVDERSRKMYQKLYNIYYKEKKYKKCKDVLFSYVKNYPHKKNINERDIEKQQFMVAQIIDYYIKKGDYSKAAKEIAWINKKEFSFDKNYINKIYTIFNYKIFHSVKKEKNTKKRREKYKNIYQNESFPLLVRSDSAWYVAKDFIKLKKTFQAFLWAQKSLQLLQDKDALTRQKNVLEMVVEMVYLHDFISAEKLAKWYFVKHCQNQYELKKDFYNAIILYSLVEGKGYKHIVKNFSQGRQCQIEKDVLFENIKVIADFFRENNRINDLKKIYEKYASGVQEKKYFKELFLDVYWESFIAGDDDEMSVGFDLLKNEKMSKDENVIGVMNFHNFIKKMDSNEKYSFKLYDPKKKFNEKIFNKKMEEEIVDLNNFKKNIEKIMATGHPQIIVYGNWVLYKKIMAFGRTLLSVSPSGLDGIYKKTFLQTMQKIGGMFLKEARKKKKKMNQIIRQSDILPGLHRDNMAKMPFSLHWGK